MLAQMSTLMVACTLPGLAEMPTVALASTSATPTVAIGIDTGTCSSEVNFWFHYLDGRRLGHPTRRHPVTVLEIQRNRHRLAGTGAQDLVEDCIETESFRDCRRMRDVDGYGKVITGKGHSLRGGRCYQLARS